MKTCPFPTTQNGCGCVTWTGACEATCLECRKPLDGPGLILCDAFGTYMAAAVGSGFLVVDPKKEEEP